MPKRLVLEVGRKAAGPAGKASGAGFARHRRSRPRRIALELARDNPVYEGMATKFLQHYVYIAYTMKHMGGPDVQLFDSEDGFFYDVLRYPDGRSQKFRVRWDKQIEAVSPSRSASARNSAAAICCAATSPAT
jgi:hypothetical protein